MYTRWYGSLTWKNIRIRLATSALRFRGTLHSSKKIWLQKSLSQHGFSKVTSLVKLRVARYLLILFDVLLVVKKVMHEEEIARCLQASMPQSAERTECCFVLLRLSLSCLGQQPTSREGLGQSFM